MPVFDSVTEALRDADAVAGEEAAASRSGAGRMRLVEHALYGVIAAAFIDSGCSSDYARLVVEHGLQQARLAYKRAMSLV